MIFSVFSPAFSCPLDHYICCLGVVPFAYTFRPLSILFLAVFLVWFSMLAFARFSHASKQSRYLTIGALPSPLFVPPRSTTLHHTHPNHSRDPMHLKHRVFAFVVCVVLVAAVARDVQVARRYVCRRVWCIYVCVRGLTCYYIP